MYTEVCGFVIVHYYTVYYSILPCSTVSIFVPFKIVPLMIYYLYFVNQFVLKFRTREDLDHTKCKRYEKSVNDVMTTISSMINPFETEQEELLSLASGVMVENDVADNLLDAEEIGEQQFVDFSKKYLLGEIPDIFTKRYEKLKRNKLQTFSSTK